MVIGGTVKPVLIVGLGNPLQGDDGVGCAIAEVLQATPFRERVPEEVQVMDLGTPGIGLINFVEGRKRVIIVDAAEMGRVPGEVARLVPEQIRLDRSIRSFSLHAPGIADSLLLAQALNLRLPDIVIFGIQPSFIGWRSGLSPAVRSAVPRVVEAVLEEVGAYHAE
jgi:hydrogenase maturation protease